MKLFRQKKENIPKLGYIKSSKGFTLVETLVAIAILSLSILGGFTAVQGSLRNSSLAKDQTTAFFLAQDSIEFIKNIRDENALRSLGGTPTNWLRLLSENSSDPCWYGDGLTPQKYCRIDSNAKQISYCGSSAGSCPILNQDTISTSQTYLLFGYTGSWTPTKFKREIRFQRITDEEMLITVTITWTASNTTKTFQISQSLFSHV